MEEEVGRPSYDAAAAVTAQGVAGTEMVALGIEGRHKLVAFAPELGCTYVHVDHDFVMTQLMLESWIVGYDRLAVVDIVFAAGGQPPLDRVLLWLKNALKQACRRDFVRRIPPEERGR